MENQGKCHNKHVGGGGEAVYGLGLIGAIFYYMQQATTVWEVLLGLVKAFVWPAFVVYKLLEFFKL